jgi:hypothetical protein
MGCNYMTETWVSFDVGEKQPTSKGTSIVGLSIALISCQVHIFKFQLFYQIVRE